MNYCSITANKEQVTQLLRWLFENVMSAGGDGDGIWYSKYYSVHSIKELIEAENLLPKFWKMTLDDGGASLTLGENQEWLSITNRVEDFNSRPEWQQVSIVW